MPANGRWDLIQHLKVKQLRMINPYQRFGKPIGPKFKVKQSQEGGRRGEGGLSDP